MVSRASGMRSIRGPEVSRGSPEVGTRRAQSPIPYTRVLPPPHTNEQVLGQQSGSSPNLSMIGSTALRVAPSACANGLGAHPPSELPRGSPRADLHPKKVFYLAPTAPANVKYANYPRAPRNRNSGLVGPHTTPPIVETKYTTSTPREVCFGLPTLGSEYY